MRRQALLLASVTIALIGAGCATSPTPYNPFKIVQEELYGKVQTIALAPVGVPTGIEHPRSVQVKFEALIGAQLRAAGFSIVSSQKVVEIWKRMAAQSGGFYNPVDGRLDKAKFQAVRAHILRELGAQFKVDAVLYANIQVVHQVEFAGNKASWDGTSELVTSSGGIDLFGPNYHGRVSTLSLFVVLEDMHGVAMYLNKGGMQVLAKIAGGKMVPVLPHELCANEERNVAAVALALSPLGRSARRQ